MKKFATPASCALLLCVGLFCLHLAAQPKQTENIPVPTEPFSLLAPNIAERSERELLERKVAIHRRFVEHVTMHSELGSPRGSHIHLTESHAGLAAAEIELYRYTGEREKLLAAQEARVKALTEKLRAVTLAYEHTTATLSELGEVEIQLLDALLEQKQEK